MSCAAWILHELKAFKHSAQRGGASICDVRDVIMRGQADQMLPHYGNDEYIPPPPAHRLVENVAIKLLNKLFPEQRLSRPSGPGGCRAERSLITFVKARYTLSADACLH